MSNTDGREEQADLLGAIQSGDRYRRDADGYFWYQGRSDDILKLGGMRVSPVEAENALVGHPVVLECALVGVDDAERLVKSKAWVVLQPGVAGRATQDRDREDPAHPPFRSPPSEVPFGAGEDSLLKFDSLPDDLAQPLLDGGDAVESGQEGGPNGKLGGES